MHVQYTLHHFQFGQNVYSSCNYIDGSAHIIIPLNIILLHNKLHHPHTYICSIYVGMCDVYVYNTHIRTYVCTYSTCAYVQYVCAVFTIASWLRGISKKNCAYCTGHQIGRKQGRKWCSNTLVCIQYKNSLKCEAVVLY